MFSKGEEVQCGIGCLNELNDDDDALNLQIETAKMKDEMQLLIVN